MLANCVSVLDSSRTGALDAGGSLVGDIRIEKELGKRGCALVRGTCSLLASVRE